MDVTQKVEEAPPEVNGDSKSSSGRRGGAAWMVYVDEFGRSLCFLVAFMGLTAALYQGVQRRRVLSLPWKGDDVEQK
ncbi:hypothetical protein BDA96_07G242800 [Sorghum bicolor]|jgi:hypothetical protein|uniref:Uncharacterized protein n=2 Tax=Sorghum bicolor TaxID=4558 RepID=A0A921UBL7_SORBI|nr:hypothetical protein BDA96_07G242800 [Sorghum bicolor]OQU81038.1 hypothetical protein SORBI_3007G227401 [Sorghum bicolor]